MKTKLAVAVAALAAVSLVGCTDEVSPAPESVLSESAPAAEPGGEETFAGATNDETIMVGPMEVIVPRGFRLPDDSIVTTSEPWNLMIADADPQPVIDAVTASAAEAGYEVFAEPGPDQIVFVGQGNAVLFFAVPNAQMITWGPEAMKDALAQAE